MTKTIGSLNEKPLHAALKAWYAMPGDESEVEVDGFIVDLVRGDLLIEIQTRRLGAIGRKLRQLLSRHPLRLVYPIAREKWILKSADPEQSCLDRRKSPKGGRVEHVFEELVSFPELLLELNFSLEVLLIREEEVRRYAVGRAWRRRGWVTEERRLLEVLERQLFETIADLAVLLPCGLPEVFTSSDIAAAIGQPRRLGQQMAYCLRKTGVIRQVGKRRNAILYTRASGEGPQAQ